MRGALEVADIFRTCGPAWRSEQRTHLSLSQLKVMSAIEQCRSAALGGHVLRCEGCGADPDRLQLLPQPPLPQVPGQRRTALARGSPVRPVTGGVLPRGLHPAGAGQRHRLLQQGHPLRSALRDRRPHLAHHCHRPQAPGSPNRGHAGAAHLGLGAHAPDVAPISRTLFYDGN